MRHFSRSSGCPGVERQFFELSSAHNCECSRAPVGLPIHDCGAVDTHTHTLIASSEQQQVFALDRIQQWTWSRTLIFQLVVVFTVFFQARVLPHRVDCLTMQRKEFKGFFALFPVRKKCEVGSALGVGTECALYSVHAGYLCGL